jgi:hypothetical protein
VVDGGEGVEGACQGVCGDGGRHDAKSVRQEDVRKENASPDALLATGEAKLILLRVIELRGVLPTVKGNAN